MADETVSTRSIVPRTLRGLMAGYVVAASLFTMWVIAETWDLKTPTMGFDAVLGCALLFLIVTVIAGIPVLAVGAVPVWLIFLSLRVTGIGWYALAGSVLINVGVAAFSGVAAGWTFHRIVIPGPDSL